MGNSMTQDGGRPRRSWRYVFESRYMKLRQDEIALPSGGEITYTVIEPSGFVVIVPVLADGRVVLEQAAVSWGPILQLRSIPAAFTEYSPCPPALALRHCQPALYRK